MSNELIYYIENLYDKKTVNKKTIMSRFTVLLITLCTCIASLQWTPASAANILAVETVPGKSHWNVMRSVIRALTDSGHNVTVFTPFVDGDRDGYTEVDMSNLIKPALNVDLKTLIELASKNVMETFVNMTRGNCDTIYEHPQMSVILNGEFTSRFDLVVTEPFMSECVAYVATVLRVPMVYVIPAPIASYLERPMTGHVSNPAVTGHVMSDRVIPKTFAERFANVMMTAYCSMTGLYNLLKYQWTDPRPYDVVDLAKPCVIFTNTHFITEPAHPLTQNIVQIGGIHLTPPEPIPKDILEFINNAPHGVIYFTFGSVISMSKLPEKVQSAFREAFAQIPQKVLWKYEGDMKDKPKNVMTRKWFPQRDILSHPNVKLFISHGGISGVYEAVDAGVPVLGFPVFYDQPRNIDSLVNAGMAISMDLLSVTKETFLNAVLEVVNNNSYQKNAKIASERFKDRPMSPAESVVYWTEYVLRHNGAPHLKSQALNLTWYQYFLVDVIITFLLLIFIVFFIIYYCFIFIYKYIFKHFHIVKPKRE